MEQLRIYIEAWCDSKKVPGINITLCDLTCCIGIYNSIQRGQKPEFISANVTKILDKCGIVTKAQGIGWVVA